MTFPFFLVHQKALDVLGNGDETPASKKTAQVTEWIVIAMFLGLLLAIFVVGSNFELKAPKP